MRTFILFILINLLTVAAFAQLAPCTGEKPARFPLAGDYGSTGPRTVVRQFLPNPIPAAPLPVTVFYPSNASTLNRVPVIFFSHAYGAINFVVYGELIDRLVSNGYAVVYVPYQTGNATLTERYEELWQGFVTAADVDASLFDLTRVGFAGHSFGGGATPEMARRGWARGWGTNGLFIFSMAPWYNWGGNMGELPASTKMVVQIYWDDAVNDHLIAQNDVWNRLSQVVEKKWQVIRASNGPCALEAGHSVPTLGGVEGSEGVYNAYDAWGVWRRLHALADYTFSNGGLATRRVAFGEDSYMGRWRGVFMTHPIAPLESYDAPVVNTTTDFAFKWSQKCAWAQGLPCGLATQGDYKLQINAVLNVSLTLFGR